MSSNLVNPAIRLIEESPEVKAFIYQQIVEFEPYVTPSTKIAVVAKDPMKLNSQIDAEEQGISAEELSRMYRISITLFEEETQINAEGLHADIFEAIRSAKDKLIKQLIEIQESVVSTQDRQEQINFALQNPQVH